MKERSGSSVLRSKAGMPMARSTRPVSESSGHSRSGEESSTMLALRLTVDDMTGAPSTRACTLLAALYIAGLTKPSLFDYKTSAANAFRHSTALGSEDFQF